MRGKRKEANRQGAKVAKSKMEEQNATSGETGTG
jgi:hypothetical protein